ncbi:hypothetical protein [Gluconobacter frateurii]|uniref:Lipoprotein n=1 Tax=Gluconobacter frateurii NRIC 0228 TaxID=1307946 RepID=A0ABQ0QE65_9PROT|nr:hypothetical protein [Gluconobacter frateurii]UMM08471.1 hypothetical protein MKW11_14990 [Gluconobacter frateurii]GBR15288.1 hypothetical protein AA0228_2473 [Gluconobacter frateurii NRIC 0228]GLP90270.1 hypothetical protein GCM10007868_13450 [Gluconobacter frateurii]
MRFHLLLGPVLLALSLTACVDHNHHDQRDRTHWRQGDTPGPYSGYKQNRWTAPHN